MGVILWLFGAIVVLFGFVVFRGAPYVPSKKKEIREAFRSLYHLDKDDLLVDIGSGDGIVLRQASSFGARAIGYELNPILVLISRLISRNDPKVKVYLADFWRVKLPPETTIVYTFGESRDIEKMARKVEKEADRLGHQLMFMSYGFRVPGHTSVKSHGGYYLYRFRPLHTREA